MARVRSPSYPSYSLPDAIEKIKTIYDRDRSNPVDREVAAQHLGYAGINGAADKSLSALGQYGLLEKVAKGEVRVSQLAIDILYPEGEDGRANSLVKASFLPNLFSILKERFPEGIPSQEALKSYLLREGYNDRAIGPITTAYIKTCSYLKQENVEVRSEFDDPDAIEKNDHLDKEVNLSKSKNVAEEYVVKVNEKLLPIPDQPAVFSQEIQDIQFDERVVYREEAGPGQYLKLVARGEVDDYLLEAIEDYVKRQRKRLNKVK